MLQTLTLLGLLLACSLGPGLFFVRRLKWSPPEKLSAAIGLSLVLLYAASFLIYALGLPQYSYYGVTAICVASSALSAGDLRRLLRHRAVRWPLIAFAFLFLVGLLLMSMVRHLSGGMWAGDWLEHYERTLFFLEHWPRDYQFIQLYSLPARPPLMNLVAAHYLAHVGTAFPHFQFVFLFLNLLVCIPLCMMLSLFARRGGRNVLVLTALLAGTPMLWQNSTFTWTKLLTAFYVVLGLWFYVRGVQKGDLLRIGAAFFSLSAGFLVHFSAGPYGLFLALHYLFTVLRWPRTKWLKSLAVVVPGVALLATWFGWSIAVYGVATTFGSNTAVSKVDNTSAATALFNVAANVYYSIFPHPAHVPLAVFNSYFDQPSSAGWWRDYLFVIYQTNVIFSMGLIGGPLLMYVLGRLLLPSDTAVQKPKKAGKPRPSAIGRGFWLAFVLFCSLVGIAVHPLPDVWGVAHICNQPLTLLGMTLLAARYLTLPRFCRWALIGGLVLDFLLGIALHYSLQSRVFPFTLTGDHVQFSDRENLLSLQSAVNYLGRISRGLAYWGDHFADAQLFLELLLVLAFCVVICLLVRFDRRHAAVRSAVA